MRGTIVSDGPSSALISKIRAPPRFAAIGPLAAIRDDGGDGIRVSCDLPRPPTPAITVNLPRAKRSGQINSTFCGTMSEARRDISVPPVPAFPASRALMSAVYALRMATSAVVWNVLPVMPCRRKIGPMALSLSAPAGSFQEIPALPLGQCHAPSSRC